MPVNRLVLTTDVNLSHYYGLDLAGDDMKVVWNAAVAYKCLKHNYGEIKLSVFDLLNSNINVSRNSTAYYVDDTESQTLKQYFLLTFTYKINNINS